MTLLFLACPAAAALPPGQTAVLDAIQSQLDSTPYFPEAQVIHPDQDAVLPGDMASPHIVWKDSFFMSDTWLVRLKLACGKCVYHLTRNSAWVPDKTVWDQVKKGAAGRPVMIEIIGFNRNKNCRVITRTQRRIHISKDRFDALILFKSTPLPFHKSKANPGLSSWRIGDIAAHHPPRVVMEGLTTCAHCHRFSANAGYLGMDIDHNNDKGGYLVTRIRPEMRLTRDQYFSWNAFKGFGPDSMGLFSTLSPDGRWIAATVNEISLFAMFNNRMYSQLFFPIAGKIAVYDRQKKNAFHLSGADRDDRVQTCPEFSPDGRSLVFAASPRNPALLNAMKGRKYLSPAPGETIAHFNQRFPIRFNLYRQPFRDGKGGTAMPLKGASQNGKSNYFPRYSPDGKWIIFCQSSTGLVLQPDSRLHVIKAVGGTARPLSCNTGQMNSWHCFTPNGRWVIFSSKAVTPYTEVLIAHFDRQGRTSPPVALMRFNREGFAANVPEALPRSSPVIRRIQIQLQEKAQTESTPQPFITRQLSVERRH